MRRIADIVKSSAEARAAFLAAALLLSAAGAAYAKGVTKTVRFPKGSKSTVVEGGVARADRDRYIVGARAGQRMTVSITSAEDNAVFQIYRPASKRALSGAGEGDDAKDWSGALPSSGNYVIVVGGTRGNAEYRLSISVE
jgi:hypothetical protein